MLASQRGSDLLEQLAPAGYQNQIVSSLGKPVGIDLPYTGGGTCHYDITFRYDRVVCVNLVHVRDPKRTLAFAASPSLSRPPEVSRRHRPARRCPAR